MDDGDSVEAEEPVTLLADVTAGNHFRHHESPVNGVSAASGTSRVTMDSPSHKSMLSIGLAESKGSYPSREPKPEMKEPKANRSIGEDPLDIAGTDLLAAPDSASASRDVSPERGRSDEHGTLLTPGRPIDGRRIRSRSPVKRLSALGRSPTAPAENDSPRRGMIKRASTFLNKLKRTTSSTQIDDDLVADEPDEPKFDAAKAISATNRKPPLPASLPAQPARNIPSSYTPPSVDPLASSVPAASADRYALKKASTFDMQSSPTAPTKPAAARASVAWSAPKDNQHWEQSSRRQRRRSISADQVPTAIRKPNEQPAEGAPEPSHLYITFSQHANSGAGAKSRRLSTNLPDEFFVDHCELSKEYKSTKLFASRGKKLGIGATAEVSIMAVRGGAKDELVAVKEFRGKEKGEDECDYIKKIKSEFTIAASLRHPNIVQTIHLCTHAGRWNHVMEYCEVGDVYRLVERGLFKTHYKLVDRLCFFVQVLRAVDYLHAHGIAHRDVKPENLLLTSSGTIKLTDFGVSEVFRGEHPGLRSAASGITEPPDSSEIRRCAPGMCGSLPYTAPEVLSKQGDYDPRPLDVWSTAITMITITFGGPPWHSANPAQPQYRRFIAGWEEWLADHPDGQIKNEEGGWPKCGPLFATIDHAPLRRLLLRMLDPDPERRIAVRDILTTTFLKNAECCLPDPERDSPLVTEENGNGGVGLGIDALKGSGNGNGKGRKPAVLPKHNHMPPREHRTPKVLQHRFDMGDGYS